MTMLSQILLLPLVGLTVLAAPNPAIEPGLEPRAITIPYSYDKGTSLNAAKVRNRTLNGSGKTDSQLLFNFADWLAETGKNNTITKPYKLLDLAIPVKNFRNDSGKWTVDIVPRSDELQRGESEYHNGTTGNPQFKYKLSSNNTGTGFSITIYHSISVNGGPILVRTVKYDLPALSEWPLKTETIPIPQSTDSYNETTFSLPINLDKYANILTLTDNPPPNFYVKYADNYHIEENNTFAAYDRSKEHPGPAKGPTS